MSVPDVEGFKLAVAAGASGKLRIHTQRAVLWAAVLASIFGLSVMARAQGRETRAVAREKAFLASVTHELRTPLATIRLFGETLAEGRGDPQEYGALVAQESQRLDALVELVLADPPRGRLVHFFVGRAKVLLSAIPVARMIDFRC